MKNVEFKLKVDTTADLASKIQGKNCKVLEITTGNIDIGDMQEIVKAIRGENIRELHLVGNQIKGMAIAPLYSFLRTNNTIEVLNLSDNDLFIGDKRNDSLRVLNNILEKNQSLQILKLCYNFMESNDVKTMAHSLKSNKVLTCLDLSNNNIDYTGLESLKEIVEVNGKIKEINIIDNKFTFINKECLLSDCYDGEVIGAFNDPLIDYHMSLAGDC